MSGKHATNKLKSKISYEGLPKTKLVWGIILIVIGVGGLFAITQMHTVLYVLACIEFIALGALLIVLYSRDKNRFEQDIRRLETKKLQEEQIKEMKLKLEQMQVDAEMHRLKSLQNETHVCPACGANTKGLICEYCGRAL